MKILFSGYHNPAFPTITEYIENAIRAAGHELFSFDDRTHVFPGRLRRRLWFLHRFDLWVINQRLLNLARRFSPDLALVSGGMRVLPHSVQKLKRGSIRTVLWTTDSPMVFGPILAAAPHYDFIFCQGSEAVELLSENNVDGARPLPMACDPAIHRPVALSAQERKRYAHDVVFIGSRYPVREALFEGLTEFDFGLWGPGWEGLSPDSPLNRCFRGGQVPPSIWTRIYSASRIVLSPHFRDPSGRVPVHQASPRVFEAMACGAFLVTDRQPDVLSLFSEGVHIAAYETVEELKNKIRYYLAHPEKRRLIAENGRREVLEKHTYVHRVSEMLRQISALRSEAPDAPPVER